MLPPTVTEPGPANANPPLVIVILTVSEYPVGFVAVQYVIPTRVEPGYTSIGIFEGEHWMSISGFGDCAAAGAAMDSTLIA